MNTLVVPLIYLDFEIRKDYISEVLCINKERTITVCGGKCFLASQLNKVQTQQDDQQAHSNSLIAINFFFNATLISKLEKLEDEVSSSTVEYIEPFIGEAPLTSIFQPPRV